MKKMIATLVLLSISSTVFANDGGIAAIKVDQIKMREFQIKNGQEVVVNKIARPNHKIIIEGGEAEKLQAILPSQVSVLTAMQPEIKEDYEKSFKALGIYSEKSAAATSKAITIECNDATLEDGKVVKTGKSRCTISISGVNEGDSAIDSFGDAQTFEPKSCK